MTKVFEDKNRVTWIPVKQLTVVWPNAQRPYRPEKAQRIADNFDPDAFGEITVCKPNGNGSAHANANGKYHIIEGQHRVSALNILWGGDEQAPCIVKADADEKRAAELFDEINSPKSRTPPTQLETFRVRLTAEKPDEVAVDRIARKCGYRVGNTDKSGRNIAACGTLLGILRRHGEDVLEATLVTIKKTWGQDANANNGTIIGGYAAFLREFGHKIDPSRLITVMEKKYTPGRLWAAAKNMKDSGIVSSATAGVVDLILTVYNARLSGDHVLKRGGK